MQPKRQNPRVIRPIGVLTNYCDLRRVSPASYRFRRSQKLHARRASGDGSVRRATWSQLLISIKADPRFLVNKLSAEADLYYLPLRITKMLGWIGLSVVLEALIPRVSTTAESVRLDLASLIVERYDRSIVAVSDEQAAPLYMFMKACLLKGWNELAEQVTNLYFGSFASRKGNVARVGADGAAALRYILSLGRQEYRPNDWRPANPSHLLTVLLMCGGKLNLGTTWDLRALDRLSTAFFIPSNHREFGREVIEQGMNYTHQIGFGIWTVPQFQKEVERAFEEILNSGIKEFPKEGVALCAVSSLLFPDRVPLLLERVL